MAASSENMDQSQLGASFLAALLASQQRPIEAVADASGAIERAAEAVSGRLQAGGIDWYTSAPALLA